MPTTDLNDVLDDLSRYIWLTDGKVLEYESRLPGLIGEGENFDLLIACVEDNILYSGGRTQRGEFIDYANAVRDFRKAKGGKDA